MPKAWRDATSALQLLLQKSIWLLCFFHSPVLELHWAVIENDSGSLTNLVTIHLFKVLLSDDPKGLCFDQSGARAQLSGTLALSVEHGEEGLECSHDHLPCFALFFLCFFRPTLPSGLQAPHRLLQHHLQATWCHPEDPAQAARSSLASRCSIGHGLCSSPNCLSYCWRSNSSLASSRIAKMRIPSFLCHDIHCTSSLGPNGQALHICSRCAPLASPFPSLCPCPFLSCWTRLRVSWDWTLCSYWGSLSRSICWILLASPWLVSLPAFSPRWPRLTCRAGHRSCRSCSQQSRWCPSATLLPHLDRRLARGHSIHESPARVPHVQ